MVYSGGNHVQITSLLGASGPDVIYCGDHLHADVVKCRKLCEWRTLLIVPELEHEVKWIYIYIEFLSIQSESVFLDEGQGASGELSYLRFFLQISTNEKRGLVTCRLFIGQKFRRKIHPYPFSLPFI